MPITAQTGRRLLASLLIFLCTSANASDWQDSYAAIGTQGMVQVLQTFASDHAMTLVLTPSLRQALRKAPGVTALRADNAPAFLNKLSTRFPFNWFAYNNKLYLSRANDRETRRIGPLAGDAEQARKALLAIGLYDSRFGWGPISDSDGNTNSVLVSGPARYVNLVRQTLRTQNPVSTTAVLMRFPLRYIAVDDRNIAGCGSSSIVPGAATLLQQLTGQLSSDNAPKPPLQANPPAKPDSPGSLPGLLGNLPIAQAAVAPMMSPSLSMPALGSSLPLPGPVSNMVSNMANPPGSNKIVADVQDNAILVRDLAKRRSYYQSLIQAIDVPSPMVSIDLLSIEYEPAIRADLDQLPVNGMAGLRRLLANPQVTVVSSTHTLTEDNQLVALTLNRHTAPFVTADSKGVKSDSADNNAGDQICIKPHLIGQASNAAIELSLSGSLREPIGELGQTPPSYTQRQLNTVVQASDDIPLFVEADTVMPTMPRQRAFLLVAHIVPVKGR